MQKRYRIVHVPHVKLVSLQPGQRPPNVRIEQFCFRVEDSLADGDYVGLPYFDEAEAKAACDLLNEDTKC